MNEKVVKNFYFVSGVFFSLAVLAGIVRLFDVILNFHKLEFLNIVVIVFLVLSLIVMITLIIYSYYAERKAIKYENSRKDEPEKLKKYVSKKNK